MPTFWKPSAPKHAFRMVMVRHAIVARRRSASHTPRSGCGQPGAACRLVRIHGEFAWHSHPETDEVFIVLDGHMAIAFRACTVSLRSGEMLVVARGVEHRPSAAEPCSVLLVESAGTVNTGDAGGERTALDGVWI